MKTMVILGIGILAGVALVAGVPAFSQDGGKEGDAKYGREVPMDPAAQQKMMEKWLAAATPGKAHERLAYLEGEWETTSKVWMGGADSGEPMLMKGHATFRWQMPGRWMAQEMSSTMMGQPYRGFGLMGYDNFRKQYVGSWIDNMSTSLFTFSGNIDRTGKVIEQYGAMDEPGLDQVGKTAKCVTRIVDENTFVFEIHDLDIIGSDPKVMEVTYERKRASENGK